MTTLQDAADAFLDQHDLARSTRPMGRATAAELGPLDLAVTVWP
jgi:hypothetical protein